MTTKYNMVKQAVKSKILDGTYTPHQKISSESELMKEFGVSRHTVRLAIGDLVTKGWLYREQGSGTFCADRSQLEREQQIDDQKKIAIITTYISDYIFPSIIRGAEARLSEEGYQVSLFSTNNNHENERMILEKILTQNFDGVIVEPTKSAIPNPNITLYLNVERLGTPYIMINATYDELEPINLVMDDEKGGFLQTEHLIKLGHQNIVGCFKTDDIQGANRMKGFLKAHRQHHVPITPSNIITYNTENRDSKPVEKLKEILANKTDQITGIVCYNDEIALDFIEVFRNMNIQIPEDISIVGYDDSFLADVSEVKLTSIKHPKIEMGKTAADTIVNLMENQKSNVDQIADSSKIYEPELVVRNSTKESLNLKST